MNQRTYDIAIVGGGIIGLATGLALIRRLPSLAITVLEKESAIGSHQTGHNSGVIHSGIYYRPGSLKARLCVAGARQLVLFCEAHCIRYELCGKVIIATEERELAVLEELYRRGMANGVPDLRKITRKELKDIEPHAAGLAALHSPSTGIVDFREVARAMAGQLEGRGASVLTNAEVVTVHGDGDLLRLETRAGELITRFLVNCAGLYADRLARRAGAHPGIRIIPFRGEYHRLRAERRDLVRSLIYPVPDPRFPFLGVHLTRGLDGTIEVGPNAVLAFSREGYQRTRIRPYELWETLTFPGFRRMARRYWRAGLAECYRSLSKGAFVRALQRLVPEVRRQDLVPGGTGIRAQAVTPDGTLVDDFHILETPSAIHVLNAPSPAATASLAIGEHIAQRVRKIMAP